MWALESCVFILTNPAVSEQSYAAFSAWWEGFTRTGLYRAAAQATDLPDIPKKLLGEVKLGGGPELSRSCDNNNVLGRYIRKVAKEKGIAYQETAAHRASGGTPERKRILEDHPKGRGNIFPEQKQHRRRSRHIDPCRHRDHLFRGSRYGPGSPGHDPSA